MEGLRPEGEYGFGFVNKTESDKENASVFYGNREAGRAKILPILPARGRLNYSEPLTLPIPSQARVRWTEDNTSHTVNVKLEGVVPKGFVKGTVYFVFTNSDTIEVTPVKWGDEEGMAKLMK